MPNQKPRILNDYRDLIWSLIPLVLIVVVFAGATSQCSFAVDGPTQGRIPTFDAAAALRSDASNLSFPVREPALPPSWTPNSGSRETITGQSGGEVSTIGYITDQGTYMQLNQSDAAEEALVEHAVGRRYASAAEQIGEQQWVVYEEPDAETAWVADFGTTNVLVRGAGDHASFATLAQAVGAAKPL